MIVRFMLKLALIPIDAVQASIIEKNCSSLIDSNKQQEKIEVWNNSIFNRTNIITTK